MDSLNHIREFNGFPLSTHGRSGHSVFHDESENFSEIIRILIFFFYIKKGRPLSKSVVQRYCNLSL
ncbi:hypothetical protein, partial [Rossellomorea marisflavi]|uniref:hypothetical protein n=1 Tax=Rossellomorea marisflavi TaxID=189381 RepID=UPI00295E5446